MVRKPLQIIREAADTCPAMGRFLVRVRPKDLLMVRAGERTMGLPAGGCRGHIQEETSA
jgi:hypothetical protein